MDNLVLLVLLGLLAYAVLGRNVARLTRVPWWLLWLVFMMPPIVLVVMDDGFGKMPPLWVMLLLVVASFCTTVFLLRWGRMAPPSVSRSPASDAIETAVQTELEEPRSANGLESNLAEHQPISEIPKDKLRGCFPWTIFYLQNLEYRPQAIICRGNLRVKADEAYERVRRNVQNLFGDRFLVVLQEGFAGKPFFALVPNPAARRTDAEVRARRERPSLAILLLGMTVTAMLLVGFVTQEIAVIQEGNTIDRTQTTVIREENTAATQSQATGSQATGSQAADIPTTGSPENNTTDPPRVTQNNGTTNPEAATPEEVGSQHQRIFADLLANPWKIFMGLPYALSLGAILLAQEGGRYWAARRHQLPISLPYFVPVPFAFGTFGAMVRLRAPVPDRKALFDVSIAGPLASLFVAVPLLFVGLQLSEAVSFPSNSQSSLLLFLQQFDPSMSILLAIVAKLALGSGLTAGQVIDFHPIAAAAWIGLLVLSLNLMPIGQLDGGHIAHAVYGQQMGANIGRVARLLVFILALALQPWLRVWALLIFLLTSGDEPALNDVTDLSESRDLLGLFVLTLVAVIILPAPPFLKIWLGLM